MVRLLGRIACLIILSGAVAVAGEPPDDPPRLPPPDPAQGEPYDGRVTEPPAHIEALAVPRLVLYPVRLIFIAAEPGTRSGLEFEQRHHVNQHIYDLLTSRDGLVGIRPEFQWTSSFRPSLGARFFDDRLMGPGTAFTAVAAGLVDVVHAEVIGRPTSFMAPVQFTFGALYDRRNDRLFAGIDNTVPVPVGVLGPSRYESDIVDVDGVVGFHLAMPLVLSLGSGIGWRHYGDGEPYGGDPTIEQVYCIRLINNVCAPNTVNPLLVPGFNTGTQFVRSSATLTLDLRDSAVESSAGFLAIAGADYTHGFAGDGSSYIRFHGSAMVPINLWTHRHVLVFRASTELLAPFGSTPVPFSELPTLGGPDDLRGFRDQLFHGHSSFIASVEYRFPVWIWMDAMLFADYGGVFGQWYDGFSAAQMQPDVGLGLRLFTKSRFFLRVQAAYGWGEGWRLSISTRSWP